MQANAVAGFTVLDVILGLLILAAAVRGAVRGFVEELGSVAALALGVWGGLRFSPYLLPPLERLMGRTLWNRVVAFLLLFLAIYVVVKLLELALHNLLSSPDLARLDQVLGFFVGAAEGILVGALILYLLQWQPLFDTRALLRNSFLARILLPLAASLIPAAPAARPRPVLPRV